MYEHGRTEKWFLAYRDEAGSARSFYVLLPLFLNVHPSGLATMFALGLSLVKPMEWRDTNPMEVVYFSFIPAFGTNNSNHIKSPHNHTWGR